jgi:MraZ protein
MFIGEYKHTIDTKKRLALPAKFRKELGQTVVITRWFDNCLVVFTEKEWQVLSEKWGNLPSGQSEARGLARVLLAGAMSVDLDNLGRVLIPEYLKKYADLQKNVTICGLFNRLEIWDEGKWEKYKTQTEKSVGDFGEKLKELGI